MTFTYDEFVAHYPDAEDEYTTEAGSFAELLDAFHVISKAQAGKL